MIKKYRHGVEIDIRISTDLLALKHHQLWWVNTMGTQELHTQASLLSLSKTLRLSSFDMARWLVSLLALQQQKYRVIEAGIQGKEGRRFLVQALDSIFDCGRTNNYHSQLALVADEALVKDAEAVSVTPLPPQQLAFMCMESAHFDHCY
ncbi:hypothetical protein KDN34_03450 [Shewanella yunxiaonensis]|uniref:Uncharacterized protein n=1 Tax=Shewanella yunxiaonensis TaxID=2829809 RepID=A0ABX7YUQ1_9GAMM|nr:MULTISPECIES: hypothetical protein [Shewanella]MDF0533182.1 hypothetical protein [Shewanella sp. A32]QUN06527.1 hypothetical protein KDN34_03450 [Shewanella yunxiaonensis]